MFRKIQHKKKKSSDCFLNEFIAKFSKQLELISARVFQTTNLWNTGFHGHQLFKMTKNKIKENSTFWVWNSFDEMKYGLKINNIKRINLCVNTNITSWKLCVLFYDSIIFN